MHLGRALHEDEHVAAGEGEFTGWSAAVFYDRFLKRAGLPVSYHGAAPFGGLAALSYAVEAAGTLDTHAVAARLRAIDLREMYARTAFDSNGQITAGMLVLQSLPGR